MSCWTVAAAPVSVEPPAATTEPTTAPTSEPAGAPATQPGASLEAARELFLKGDYEEAEAIYYELAGRPEGVVRAACGRAEIDLLLGDYTDGITRLDAVAGRGEASADWHVRLAALLTEVGRYDEAIEHCRRALTLAPNHFRASWLLGRLYETLGRTDEAIEAYKVFEDILTHGALPDDPEALTCIGQGFLRRTALTRNENLVRRTRHVLQEVYQEVFDRLDTAYWPARLAAAELLLEKHSLGEAKSDFDHILAQDPRVAAAHVGLGRIALESWEFGQAEDQAQAALEINPHCVEAEVLLAGTHMVERRYDEAAAAARRALESNPNSLDALSVLAAAELRTGDRAASEKTQQRAEKISARPALLHHVLGVWLSAARQFPEAAEHLKKAIEFAPTWSEPQTELGLLYMETGEDEEARRVLEASFALDGFNGRTFNVLDLLDTLDKFKQIKTAHFLIKYDEAEDAILAPYFAEALEEMYPEVCGAYGYEPSKPTIVELFPDHYGFSVRISTRPFIATVGACSGRVIALASPRRETAFGIFNWRTVLRHEFAHAVTLDATGNRIPHWMTEGLAVSMEQAPRSLETKMELAAAVRQDQLFTLETIDWGFIRPRKSGDRAQAYAQSEWMIEYIAERYGEGAVGRLLKAFRDGLNQKEAFA